MLWAPSHHKALKLKGKVKEWTPIKSKCCVTQLQSRMISQNSVFVHFWEQLSVNSHVVVSPPSRFCVSFEGNPSKTARLLFLLAASDHSWRERENEDKIEKKGRIAEERTACERKRERRERKNERDRFALLQFASFYSILMDYSRGVAPDFSLLFFCLWTWEGNKRKKMGKKGPSRKNAKKNKMQRHKLTWEYNRKTLPKIYNSSKTSKRQSIYIVGVQ